ncbi:hypothetical protein Golax_009984, partial [Gossypium laxum]|nr:hypothetical protein [Gossypium laxum]
PDRIVWGHLDRFFFPQKFQELGIQKFQELQQAFGIQKNPFGSYRGSPKDLNDLVVGPDPAKNCVYLTTDGLVRNEDSFVTARGFGILDGLKLTLQRDYNSVLIQTYSLEPVNAIQDVSLGILIRLLSREFTSCWT